MADSLHQKNKENNILKPMELPLDNENVIIEIHENIKKRHEHVQIQSSSYSLYMTLTVV